jgi:hypothetical protein
MRYCISVDPFVLIVTSFDIEGRLIFLVDDHEQPCCQDQKHCPIPHISSGASLGGASDLMGLTRVSLHGDIPT